MTAEPMPELKRTPLHAAHIRAAARMAPFAGWSMPVAYGSQIGEHHAVRRAAGLFDVSHMTLVDVAGADAQAYLRRLLANDVARLARPCGGADGAALYSCMLDERGGVLDDLIAYRFADRRYRLIGNAGTRARDMAWFDEQAAGFEVTLAQRSDLAMLAVQGPTACRAVARRIPEAEDIGALAPFTAARRAGMWLARTGYTGEDGLEIMLPAHLATALWEALRADGVAPCGLGARDTLRLEAGLNLYGQDMDESVTPLECGLGWTVDFGGKREFIGRRALEERRRAGVAEVRVGLVLEDRGVLRSGHEVVAAAGAGVVTSGTFSPTLRRAIALARMPTGATAGGGHVMMRGRKRPVRIVKPPFVRNGRILVDPERTE